jgi:hypothetical protein
VTIGVGCVVVAFVAATPAGAVPVVDRLSPAAGQVDNVVVLAGIDLAGSDIRITFGRAAALAVSGPDSNNRLIRVIVPNKVDPRDPDTVAVRLSVDGIEALAPSGPPLFTYTIPQPLASISDVTSGDPAHPRSVFPEEPFVLTLTGSNFLMARRAPQKCIAVNGGYEGVGYLVGSPGDSSASFFFPGLAVPGDYEFFMAFSDGSGASLRVPDFVQAARPIFGFPPDIESVSFDANPQQSVRCDFSAVVEGYLCSFGILGAIADPGVFIDGTFTHVRFEAKITDPDSTPTRSDVLLATASFTNPDAPLEVSAVLFDDGSANAFPTLQHAILPEDCTDEGFGVCTCSPRHYAVRSGDALANDAVYTRDLAFLDRGSLSLGLLQDCILQHYGDVPIDFVPGSSLEFRIEAIDHEGNLASWPSRPAVTVGAGSYSCTGDACGCCFLTSADPVTECVGKPGMPSIDFPAGVCLALF